MVTSEYFGTIIVTIFITIFNFRICSIGSLIFIVDAITIRILDWTMIRKETNRNLNEVFSGNSLCLFFQISVRTLDIIFDLSHYLSPVVLVPKGGIRPKKPARGSK